MLTLHIPANELWDKSKQEFIQVKEQTLKLEHSLVSLSKWESKWHKSFLFTKEKTIEEVVDYIKCMTLTQNVDPNVYLCLTQVEFDVIGSYINEPMTATTITEDPTEKKSRRIITAEVIYSWMVAQHIPFECQKWHLNRLLMLIRVCGENTKQPKKRRNKDILAQNAALNAARKKQFKTKG